MACVEVVLNHLGRPLGRVVVRDQLSIGHGSVKLTVDRKDRREKKKEERDKEREIETGRGKDRVTLTICEKQREIPSTEWLGRGSGAKENFDHAVAISSSFTWSGEKTCSAQSL